MCSTMSVSLVLGHIVHFNGHVPYLLVCSVIDSGMLSLDIIRRMSLMSARSAFYAVLPSPDLFRASARFVMDIPDQRSPRDGKCQGKGSADLNKAVVRGKCRNEEA